MKITKTIMKYLFLTAFLACITMAALHFNSTGLFWWYLLPTFLAFCAILSDSEDGKKGGKDD